MDTRTVRISLLTLITDVVRVQYFEIIFNKFIVVVVCILNNLKSMIFSPYKLKENMHMKSWQVFCFSLEVVRCYVILEPQLDAGEIWANYMSFLWFSDFDIFRYNSGIK